MALILRSQERLTNPLPGTPSVDPPALASDSFNGPDTASILGRITDSYAGGKPVVWEGLAVDTLGITNGALSRNGNPGIITAGIPIPTPDVEVHMTILDSGIPVENIDIRRGNLDGNPYTGYRLNTRGWAQATRFVVRDSGGTITYLEDGPILNRGDTLIFGAYGNRLYAGVNGEITHVITDDTISTAGYVATSGGSGRDPIIDSIRVLPARPVTA